MLLPKNAAKHLKGLMCAFGNATCAALSEISKNSHDSLARVLNGEKFCWQTLLQNFILRTFGKLQGGYLMLGGTIISKQFARNIENVAWLYDSKIGRSILGLNIVLIAWSNGEIALPLAIGIYQKKSGKTKIDLAAELIGQVKKLGIKPRYITFDSWYAAQKVFKAVAECQWTFVAQLKSNRKLNGIPLKEIRRNPYWMMEGKIAGGLKVVIARNGKKYFASNGLTLSKKNCSWLTREDGILKQFSGCCATNSDWMNARWEKLILRTLISTSASWLTRHWSRKDLFGEKPFIG